MNSASNVSSHQGTPPLKKNGGRGSTEKQLDGAVGGRSVLSVAGGDTPAIVSRQGAGITGESAGCALLRKKGTAQRAPSGVALTVPVDRTASVQSHLQCELEIVNKLISELKISGDQAQPGKPGDQAQTEMTSQTMTMCCVTRSVMAEVASVRKISNRCKKRIRSRELNKKLGPVFDYIKKTGDRDVAKDACRSTAYVLYFRNHDVINALQFFQKVKEFEGLVDNFPESFLIQHLALVMGVADGLSIQEISDLFQPDRFYDEIKRWLPADEFQEKELKESLRYGFAENGPKVEIFRDGIKALFEEGGLPAAKKVEHSIVGLTRINESGSGPEWLRYSVDILKFAKNLRLVEEGYLKEALKNVERAEEHQFKYLDEYIRFRVLEKTGKTDQAAEVCKQGVIKGYPFLNYLTCFCAEES